MNHLQDYMESKQSKLFKSTGTFFAFSKSQFDENKVEGIKYAAFPSGMVCPKENVKTLQDGLTKIQKDSIQQDIDDNGLDKIIIRELYNHECFYTSDYHAALNGYSVTLEQVKNLFYKELPNSDL